MRFDAPFGEIVSVSKMRCCAIVELMARETPDWEIQCWRIVAPKVLDLESHYWLVVELMVRELEGQLWEVVELKVGETPDPQVHCSRVVHELE